MSQSGGRGAGWWYYFMLFGLADSAKLRVNSLTQRVQRDSNSDQQNAASTFESNQPRAIVLEHRYILSVIGIPLSLN